MSKRSSKSKRPSKALPALGIAGVTLALASAASASTGEATTNVPSASHHEIFLGEEEISDVSLATFYVFDKENAGLAPARPKAKTGPLRWGLPTRWSLWGLWRVRWLWRLWPSQWQWRLRWRCRRLSIAMSLVQRLAVTASDRLCPHLLDLTHNLCRHRHIVELLSHFAAFGVSPGEEFER